MSIKDNVKSWPSSKNKQRKIEIIMTRIRIYHTRLAHGHFMEGRPAPYCGGCIVSLTVEHIIAECLGYWPQRQLYFNNEQLTLAETIGEKPQMKIEIPEVIQFLDIIGIISQIYSQVIIYCD